MFFVSNRLPSSQAECRRFDPGLPLHLSAPSICFRLLANFQYKTGDGLVTID